MFEDGLKNLDSKALTGEGVIKTYKIDYDSIEHDPMGGINVTIIVNGDSKLAIEYILSKKHSRVDYDGMDLSIELSKKLGRWSETDE